MQISTVCSKEGELDTNILAVLVSAAGKVLHALDKELITGSDKTYDFFEL